MVSTHDSAHFSGLTRRAFDRRAFLRGTLALGAGGVAIATVGCGSSSSGDTTPSATASGTPGPGAIKPVLLTTEFVAGQDNRFAVGLLDSQAHLVRDAAVHLRFFTIGEDGSTGTFRGEGDATFFSLDVPGAHAHDSTSGDAATDDSVAFYVANTPFDVAGKWGVEMSVKPNDGSQPPPVDVPIDVLDKPITPGVGTVPPASRNDTTATNSNASSLCSRVPACPLHDKVIGDVLGKGRPLVVQFSTPAFCQTRFCGPVLEELLTQVPVYQDRVDFVHIEVWQDFQLHQYRPAVQEWKLPGEPYTFFMSKDGKVLARFEAIFSDEELKTALELLVTA